jgi:hypothetical protein
MKDFPALEMELRALLIEAEVPTASNQLTLGTVRKSLTDFLTALEEEFEMFPEERNESQWTLVMVDGDQTALSTFMLFVTSPTQVHFAAGQGMPHEVRDVAEHFDGGAEESIDQFGRKFKLALKRCEFPKALIDAWTFR